MIHPSAHRSASASTSAPRLHAPAWALAAAAVSLLISCSASRDSDESTSATPIAGLSENNPTATAPSAMHPIPLSEFPPRTGPAQPQDLIDLTLPGSVVRGTKEAQIIDTRRHQPQIRPAWDAAGAPKGSPRRVRELLPPHSPPPAPGGEGARGGRSEPPLGTTLEETRTVPKTLFPGIGQTGWVPPDPALAVGPNHVVTTVNQTIAFYTKAGVLQYQNALNNAGNPGFFETVGSGGFTFDPKCFYDHLAQRFVVVAPEVYGSTEAWIAIAVSDDSDPNGVWYKYRTDAVITVGAQTYWWDYPGFGYDAQGYYVTCNLFGLNQGGFGGVGFRVFDKAPMLTGAPAVYSTLRDGGGASAQVAQHFGANTAPFFVSTAGSSSLRVYAITNPLTSPTLVSTTVGVPSFSGPTVCPTNNNGSLSLVDARIFNAHWRNGKLFATHNISSSGRNFARWYDLNTNSWPTSGGVSLVQSGNVDGGSGVHTFFPAIYSNAAGAVGMVLGTSSAVSPITVSVTGRLPADPPGTMGFLTPVKVATASGSGRWGDYYDIAIDPVDDSTFWVVGEYPEPSGWANWITSFEVASVSGPRAFPDLISPVVTPTSRTIDVMANDFSNSGLPFVINRFDAASLRGGTVTRSVGTGPGGRDQLIYTAPLGYTGEDSFTYTLRDTANVESTTTVSAPVFDPNQFRNPDAPTSPLTGVDVAYYDLTAPDRIPDFTSLAAFSVTTATSINFANSGGNFAGSARADNVGAVFFGYVDVPLADLYTFYTNSDEGSRLFIGDTQIVSNDGLHGMTERSGVIGLKPGLHRIRVEYFEATGNAGLTVSIAGGGLTKQVIPTTRWKRDNPATTDFRAPDVVINPQPAADTAFYALSSGLTVLPNFATLSPYLRTTSANIDVPSTNGVFSTSGRADNVGAVYTGFVNVPATAEYTFYTESDDGSRLYVGGLRVVDNDGLHGMVERSGRIRLRAGTHIVRVEFFEGGGGAGLIARLSAPTLAKQPIPASMWQRSVCPQDFNSSGAVSSQDIFDFLAAFFANDPRADFNHSGTVSSQDVFDFLAAYFTPC